MSNKNNKNGNNRVVKGNIVATITANLNKHGEIKGSNKKETKNLKAMCPHHKLTKKGKNKAMVWNNGDGSLKCTMCDNRVPTDLKSKEDVKKTVIEGSWFKRGNKILVSGIRRENMFVPKRDLHLKVYMT